MREVKLLFYTGNFLFYMTSRSYLTILTNKVDKQRTRHVKMNTNSRK